MLRNVKAMLRNINNGIKTMIERFFPEFFGLSFYNSKYYKYLEKVVSKMHKEQE